MKNLIPPQSSTCYILSMDPAINEKCLENMIVITFFHIILILYVASSIKNM